MVNLREFWEKLLDLEVIKEKLTDEQAKEIETYLEVTKEKEESIVEVSEGDFIETFGRPPNDEEWDWFVHYIKKGVEAQLDWQILYECTRDLKDTILTKEEKELDTEKVLAELNSKDKDYDFVRIENQWKDDGFDIYKVVVSDGKKQFFVEVTVDGEEIDVGDLEEYDIENDTWE